jgi:hypothetical protein
MRPRHRWLHELAHATTTQMGLPILGKKEDAADAFAVTRLIKLGSGFSDRVLVAAGKGFFLSGRRDEKTGGSVPYYDEHGLDQQRGYDVVCLMVGTGQDKYQHLADEALYIMHAKRPKPSKTETITIILLYSYERSKHHFVLVPLDGAESTSPLQFTTAPLGVTQSLLPLEEAPDATL